MFKLPDNCAHFAWQQDYAQNPSSYNSAVHHLRNSRCTSWIKKRQRNQRSSCQPLLDHREEREFQKTSTSASLTKPNPLTVWMTTHCGKLLKRWEYQTTLPVLWEICMWVKKQQLEPYMEQWSGSELGKEYIKAVYCHPAYLTYMQNTSWEMLGWMQHKLESRLQGELSITSDMQMTPLLSQKVKRN